jgi:hypothetical protein
VKLTSVLPSTVTFMVVWLSPDRFDAFIVTTNEHEENAQVNVWLSGSWRLDVVPSAKSQSHAVG